MFTDANKVVDRSNQSNQARKHSRWLILTIAIVLIIVGSAFKLPDDHQASKQQNEQPKAQHVTFHAIDKDYLEEWQAADEYNINLGGIVALNKQVAFIYGTLGAPSRTVLQSFLLRTGDGGKHWTDVMKPEASSAVQQLLFIDQQTGWALVAWEVESPGSIWLYRTDDGGQHWRQLLELPKRDFNGLVTDISFQDAQHGKIVMDYQGALEDCQWETLSTDDGGKHWQSEGCHASEQADSAISHTPAVAQGFDQTEWQIEEHDDQFAIQQRANFQADWQIISVMDKKLKLKGDHLSMQYWLDEK